MPKKYKPASTPFDAYDASWHEGHDVVLGYPYLHCRTCQVVTHIDLVGTRIAPEESHKHRKELPDA